MHATRRRHGPQTAASVASADPEAFAEICSRTPAIHRFPGSMAARIQSLAQQVVEEYDGDVTRLWNEAETGKELLRRIQALPGFGKQKG